MESLICFSTDPEDIYDSAFFVINVLTFLYPIDTKNSWRRVIISANDLTGHRYFVCATG